MGGGMARNLLVRGFRVTVHDIERTKVDDLAQAGAVACTDAAAAASATSVSIVCVVDASQCEQVLFSPGGLCERAGGMRGHTVMLCPTIAAQDTEQLASRAQALGAEVIDAPMSGGPQRAAAGTMSLMVACSDHVFDAHRTLLEALSSRIFRLGSRLGDGARAKLVNNLLAGINLVGAAEALVLAQRMGLDPQLMLSVIEQSSGQSWIGSDRMRRALAGDYEPRAHVTLLEKDTALALHAAQALGLKGPLGAAAHDVFSRTAQAGMADWDDAAIFKWLAQTMSDSP